MHRWLIPLVVVSALCALGVAPPPGSNSNAVIEQTLTQLDQVGQSLKEFTAKLTLVETDEDLQTSSKKTG